MSPGWSSWLPLRYGAFALCVAYLLLAGLSVAWRGTGIVWLGIPAALCLLGLHDLIQTRRAVLRNYPVIGHLRFLLEYVRPEIRQYFIESDTEAAPFSRSQRSLVYQRAKGDPDKRPFGTQIDVGQAGYEWLNHSLMPRQLASHDFRVTIGADTSAPYEASVFNISAMSKCHPCTEPGGASRSLCP